jgi:hypothetical protein
MYALFCWEVQKEIENYEDLDVGWRIMLNCILEILDGVVRTRLIWLRIRISGGLLLTQQ